MIKKNKKRQPKLEVEKLQGNLEKLRHVGSIVKILVNINFILRILVEGSRRLIIIQWINQKYISVFYLHNRIQLSVNNVDSRIWFYQLQLRPQRYPEAS